MGMPAGRITDMHMCPMVTPGVPPIPHVGGPILPPGCPTVLLGGIPAARVTDMALCVGPPDVIVRGSVTVLIGGLPAARLGDNTADGGVIALGLPTVLIGDAGGPGGLSAQVLPSGAIQVGNALVIEGTPSFQSRVMADLAAIGVTPS